MIYADNGKIFISDHFKRICAELGIRLLNHLPYSPQSKGKVERIIFRIQQEFLMEAGGVDLASIEELNSFFQAWIEVEYHRKEHHSIGCTPLDRFTEALKTTKIRTVESMEEITEIFLYREKRKVLKERGIVKLCGNEYQITDTSLLGDIVEVRFDPYDLSKTFIYKDNAFVQIALPATLNRTQYKNIPQENTTKESVIRQSSLEFFTKLKQREEELNQKQIHRIDFTKTKKGEQQ